MAASLVLWGSDTYWCKAQGLQVWSVVLNCAGLSSDSNSLQAVLMYRFLNFVVISGTGLNISVTVFRVAL